MSFDGFISSGPFITAGGGKFYCPEHFKCGTPNCSRPLIDIGFVEERGQLYCEYCWESYLAPVCAKCNKRVKNECLNALGQQFHPTCFTCSHCHVCFGNNPFYLEDGRPFCEKGTRFTDDINHFIYTPILYRKLIYYYCSHIKINLSFFIY